MEINVEKTMTWQVVKPEARTEQLKMLIKMAYEEGYDACCDEANEDL